MRLKGKPKGKSQGQTEPQVNSGSSVWAARPLARGHLVAGGAPPVPVQLQSAQTLWEEGRRGTARPTLGATIGLRARVPRVWRLTSGGQGPGPSPQQVLLEWTVPSPGWGWGWGWGTGSRLTMDR